MDGARIAALIQQYGPLPLASRAHLAEGWPEMLADLETRYGDRWR